MHESGWENGQEMRSTQRSGSKNLDAVKVFHNLANVSLNCLLLPGNTVSRCLSHWLVWFSWGSTDAPPWFKILQIKHIGYKLGRPRRVCEQIGRFRNDLLIAHITHNLGRGPVPNKVPEQDCRKERIRVKSARYFCRLSPALVWLEYQNRKERVFQIKMPSCKHSVSLFFFIVMG